MEEEEKEAKERKKKKFQKTAKDYYCLNEKVECCKMDGDGKRKKIWQTEYTLLCLQNVVVVTARNKHQVDVEYDT